MDRNLRHSAYAMGPRSLPHTLPNGKRHSQDSRYDMRYTDVNRHSGDVRHSDMRPSGDVRQDMRHDMRHDTRQDVRHDVRHERHEARDARDGRDARQAPRLSPPFVENNNNNHHDDLISYIYDSWSKVTREVERGCETTKYYIESDSDHLADFTPFDLEEWWGIRMMQNIKKQQHRF